MKLPKASTIAFTPDLRICRLLNGMWQVSGAHGSINPEAAIRSMFDFIDAGLGPHGISPTTTDPQKISIGEFRRQTCCRTRHRFAFWNSGVYQMGPRPGRIAKPWVESNIDISRDRMGVDQLDLLQFHWWDYEDENYLSALTYLAELRDEGKLRHLALTNFDTDYTFRASRTRASASSPIRCNFR